jgi:hypothetical protein
MNSGRLPVSLYSFSVLKCKMSIFSKSFFSNIGLLWFFIITAVVD